MTAGHCRYCTALTKTTAGPSSKFSRSRHTAGLASTAYRLGYAYEKVTDASDRNNLQVVDVLVCVECMTRMWDGVKS